MFIAIHVERYWNFKLYCITFFPKSALLNSGCGLSTDAAYTWTFTVSLVIVHRVQNIKPVVITSQFCYTFYIPQTKRLCLGRPLGNDLQSPCKQRAMRQQGYGLRLLIFKMVNNKVDMGQIRSEEIVYSRFIKIPLG